MKLSRQWPAVVLIALGFISPIGYALDIKALRGIGLSWMLSPLPIVFSDTRGYEAFAAKFRIRVLTASGDHLETPITFIEGENLRGPYNRRNIYGAAIGYAPRIPEAALRSVLRHGFCRPEVLPAEFGLPANVAAVELHVQDGTRGRDVNYSYEVVCR